MEERVKELTLVESEDWCAIYIDGKMLLEGHSVTTDEWLELLSEGVKYNTARFYVEPEYIEEEGFHQFLMDYPHEILLKD